MESLMAGDGFGGRFSYFEVQALWGVRKPHYGGFRATQELAEMCSVAGELVLDLGCGMGISAHYISQRYGCEVVGVDVSRWVVKEAKRRGCHRLVEFVVADAHRLPFRDWAFGVVVGERVC